ncbi:MAG: hypothetical protein R3A52_25525 [Polyangiales bacterium]
MAKAAGLAEPEAESRERDDDVRERMTRPLLSAVQAAADRVQREFRALGGDRVRALEPLAAELKALHVALFQIHALYGGVLDPGPGVPVDAVSLLYTVADEVYDAGVRVRVECRSPGGVFHADPPAARRILKFLVDRASAVLTDRWVPVTVLVSADAVAFEIPWEEEEGNLLTLLEERAWLESEVAAQRGVFTTDGARARLEFARVPLEQDVETPESLVREVLDLRRERDTFLLQVERTSSELQVMQSESEDLRRRFNRLERTLTAAAGDLGRAFESIEALSGLLSPDEPMRNDIESAARLGGARVEELAAEVETLSASQAPVWARDGSVPEETPPDHEAWSQLRALQVERPPRFPELERDEDE